MSLVENVKSLCDAVGMSVPKLEKELGFGKGSIYNWEKSSPSIDKIEKVASYFDVSLNRVLYGFDANKFSNLTNIARGDRTLTQFSIDTGIEQNEIVRICLGYPYDKPPIETVRKIVSNNQHSLLFGEDDFLEAAGYVSERQVDTVRKRAFDELVERYKNSDFYVIYEEKFDEIHISRATGAWTEVLSLNEFLEKGFDLLNQYESIHGIGEIGGIHTIAAHHDGEDWTEEELDDIERFKEFVKSKRKQQE